MKIENLHIEFIKQAFATMKSNSDFLKLMNYAKSLLYGEKAYPFKFANINYYLSMRAVQKDDTGSEKSKIALLLDLLEHSGVKVYSRTAYHKFTIGKKTGGVRVIHAPKNGLKEIQKCLNIILQAIYTPHEAATGFVEGKSIVDNASIHCKQNYVYNIDLKDFFSSIDQARFWKRLQYPPFNLTPYINDTEFARIFLLKGLLAAEKTKARRYNIANIIASLCFTEMEVERKNEKGEWIKVKRNVLPQGAPTSPTITNIICERLDRRLSGLAKRFGLKYSRYADDITFSSMHFEYAKDGEFIKELNRIITDQNFDIKDSKTRLQKQGYKQEVTGLVVNEQANVNARYIKELRMWLYTWEKYGYEKAYNYFLLRYKTDKGHIKKGKPDMGNVIAGKLDYLKMVKGADNELYLKLKRRFDAITVINKDKIITSSISLDETLPKVYFENIYATREEAHQQATNKLRININPIDSANGQIKLKRKIIIDKGKFLPLEEILENNENEEKEIDLSKHKPIDVTRFLLNFRSSEGLKFLTHDYDKPGSVFDYDKIIAISKREFKELTTELIVPVNLLSRINQFAFGDPTKAWWFNKLPYKLNWQSHELLRWMETNPITHPIKNEDFEKGFITPFKKSIEIKSPDLEYIFKNKLAENLASNYLSFNIELVDLDKANFYTNVDALQVGISYLFKSINQRFKNSNKIRVEFSRKADEEGRKRIIKIIHFDSKCDKPLDKKELFQGDLLEAEKAFFGICDWSIISKSPDNSVNKLNVLFDISTCKIPREKIEDSLIEGFTHVLTFYA